MQNIILAVGMPQTDESIIQARSFLITNLDTMLESLSVRREAHKNDADDLFSFDEPDQEAEIHWNKQYQNIDRLEVLIREKESLGLYVSGNPLDDYREILIWCRETTTRDDIYLVLLDKTKKVFTKSGNMMFALQITTLEAEELEGIIFPKNALTLSPKLEERQLFWVKGKIARGRGKKKEEEVAEVAAEETSTGEDQIQEFEEKPKLAIDALARFEEGVLPLFESEDIRLAVNRIQILQKVDWTGLLKEPNNLSLLEGGTSTTITQDEQERLLRIPITYGADKLKTLKTKLLQTKQSATVPIKLEIETKEGWKMAKGNFWLKKEEYEEVSKELNL